MGYQQKMLISSFFIALVLLSCSWLSTCDEEVEDQSEFTYDPKDTEKGPYHWGDIKSEWKLCNDGEMQSPIDLKNDRVETIDSDLGSFNIDYKPSNATLTNRGHDMELKWASGAGHIEINGTKFELKQAHWHSPSEHTINGKRFHMEFHLVHESDAGNNAVVSILYKIGRPDSFLKTIENHFEPLEERFDEERNVGIINPLQVEIETTNYYRYIGSLTTPPCSQNVTWTIIKKVRTVSKEQLELIRDAVNDESENNARPLQSVNKRPVNFFGAKDQLWN